MSEQLSIGYLNGRHPELVVRRLASATEAARPFLKWVGGKSQLLPALDPFFPADIPDYTEPFLGGGAVFFHLRATGRLSGSVRLADANPELVNAYCVVRDEVEELIAALTEHKKAHSRDHYYRMREQDFMPGVPGAARMLYLNKTCYNGLYRVNAKGQFNVPMGTYSNPRIFDADSLRRASRALQGVSVVRQDFRRTIEETLGGLIYADPPYVPLSVTSSFTDYAPGGFGMAEQQALADGLRRAHRHGVQFILSNSHTATVLHLYCDFDVRTVLARRAVNSNANGRGRIAEAVVLSFVPPAPASVSESDRVPGGGAELHPGCAG